MTRIRTIHEFLDPKCGFDPTSAERALIDACRAGGVCKLGDGVLPEEDSEARRVRAELIRLLILGGTEACGLDGSEVWLEGAWVTGVLDLRSMQSRGRLVLGRCHFTHRPDLHLANLDYLSLQGSHLPGLFAEALVTRGSVRLSDATFTDTVSFSGARIGGQMACSRSCFSFEKSSYSERSIGKSFRAQHMKVAGSLHFEDSTFRGTLNIGSAEISGDLNCNNVTLDGCGGDALFAQSIKILGCFVFMPTWPILGDIILTSGSTNSLVDNPATWNRIDAKIDLVGFEYNHVHFDTDVSSRIKWLKKVSRFNKTFSPQPYTQLAKVYASMGHNRLARRVLFEREYILAAERKKADQARLDHLWHQTKGDGSHESQALRGDIGVQWLRLQFWQAISAISRRLVGYGYRPQLALFWALGAILFSTVLYFIAYRTGAMVPDSPVVLTSTDWLEAMKSDAVRTTLVWQNTPSAMHYETFNAGAFATDVFLPIIELGQESAWAATTTTTLGCIVWAYTWAVQLFGWLVSALGVAAITGIMQKDRD